MNRSDRVARVVSRTSAVLVIAMSMMVLAGAPAWADPPQPTNYRSRLLAVEPEVDGAELEVVGGDAFLRLTVQPGVEALVLGYGDGAADPEPYLRFEADGSVLVNLRSPAHYLNQDRYGAEAPPPDADATAAPRWQEVAEGGTYSWHDHRIHWMSPQPPARIATEPARQHTVFEWTVPFQVDGRPVEARGELLWLPSRSPLLPSILGLVVLIAAALGVRAGDRTRAAGGVVAIAAAVALLVSVGAAFAPGGAAVSAWTGLVLAIVALALGILVVRERSERLVPMLVAASGAVIIWAVQRLPVLTAPVLPSAFPDLVDWAGTTVALAAAIGAVLGWSMPSDATEGNTEAGPVADGAGGT